MESSGADICRNQSHLASVLNFQAGQPTEALASWILTEQASVDVAVSIADAESLNIYDMSSSTPSLIFRRETPNFEKFTVRARAVRVPERTGINWGYEVSETPKTAQFSLDIFRHEFAE